MGSRRTAARGAGRHGPGHVGLGQHDRQVPRPQNRRAQEKGRQAIRRSRGGLTCKLHVVAADERTPLALSLSSAQAADGPVGRALLRALCPVSGRPALLMARASESDRTRQLARELGYEPIVPPKSNRRQALGLRHAPLPSAQRDRTPTRTAQALPTNRHPPRKTRRHFPQRDLPRIDLRPAAIDVNRP